MSLDTAAPAIAETNAPAAFHVALTQTLLRSAANDYGVENLDPDRPGLGASTRRSWGARARQFVNRWLPGNIRLVSRRNLDSVAGEVAAVQDYLPGLAALYEMLDDQTSREMLVQIVAFRLLGPTKVKLGLNNPHYWNARRDVQALADAVDALQLSFLGQTWTLNRFDLKPIGIPVQLYATLSGVLTVFLLKQYVYQRSSPPVRVEPDDIVIDAGACWGDTTLSFAEAAGAAGRVFAFEFVPRNVEMLTRNLQLNPELNDCIEVVRQPLWNTSDVLFHCSDEGPGSRVAQQPFEGARFTTRSCTIDDFVSARALPRVDFIKMDIEGAEPFALEGASETIRQYRPKLAISLYHSWNDFVEVPRRLADLDLGYRFYLDHFTLHREETVLFAMPG